MIPLHSQVCQQYVSNPTPQNQLNCGNGPVWAITSLSPLKFNITYMATIGGYTRYVLGMMHEEHVLRVHF